MNTPAVSALPDWLKYGLGVLVAGLFLQFVSIWSLNAAYMFAILILLGFLSVHNRIGMLYDTLHSLGIA